MGIYGQDWASYQGSAPSTSGIDFFFTKVTEGMGYVNPYWKSQYAHGKAAGLAAGKYHYPHMGNAVHNEAGYFINNANIQPGDMIVLDWEGYDPNNQGVSNSAKAAYKDAWLKYVKALFPHNPVGVYCNKDYWFNVDTTGYFCDFLWIATAGDPAGQPGIKAPWKFHQYSAAGVDHDYGNFASKADLVSWIHSFDTSGEDMPLTHADAVTIWGYKLVDAKGNPTEVDMHQALDNAARDAAAAKAGVATLQADVAALKTALGSFDPAKLQAALVAAVDAAIAKDAVTATVEVNGKAV